MAHRALISKSRAAQAHKNDVYMFMNYVMRTDSGHGRGRESKDTAHMHRMHMPPSFNTHSAL